MTFDDVNAPAVLFVCVSMAVALVGNSLVLLVFGCRWRTTNDTKIYIMALAILDLVCALVSFPRDLITLLPESQCLVRKSDMHVYCKLSVFLTHHLNVTSALILVAIAASRYVKVSKGDRDDSSGSGRKLQKAGFCSGAFTASLRKRFYAFKTVRGAKISIAVAACLAVINGSPALVLFGSGAPEEARVAHTFRNVTFQNGTAEPVSIGGSLEEKNYFCHSACRDDIRGDLKVFRKVFDISQFVVFLILTLVLMGIYGAVLQKLCGRKGNQMCCSGSGEADKSAAHHEEPTVSSVAHLQPDNNDDDCFEDQSLRPLTTTTTTTTTAERGERKETVSCASDLLLSENAADGVRDKPARAAVQRARSNSDSVQFRNNSHGLSFFPPLSYSSQNWSEISLNRQTSQARDDGQSQSNRLSTTSFQLTKTGNQARMTTLVFLLVTLIYVVSYCPYFVVILSLYAAGDRDPGQVWGASGHVWMEVCRRSYLIANAANPLVYGLCNPYFREQLGKLLICRRDII